MKLDRKHCKCFSYREHYLKFEEFPSGDGYVDIVTIGACILLSIKDRI